MPAAKRKVAAAAVAAPAAPAAGVKREPVDDTSGAGAGAGAAAARPPTAFEARVYALCSAVPAGKATTYGDLARALGPPASSARAVGQAMRRNPFAPRVPCHRVVAADGRIGGFQGVGGAESANVRRKREMLVAEGAAFDAAGRVAPRCLVRADELKRLAVAAAAAKGAKAAPAAAKAAAPAPAAASSGDGATKKRQKR